MKLPKDEIAVELDHQRKIIHELHRRRRVLEIQVVQQGINALPQIITELESLTEQIHKREAEIAELETQVVEDKLSLAEAEYRALLAEIWDTSLGRPTIAGEARLELARLKLGLPTERSHEIEQAVRIKLAEEAFARLDLRLIELLPVRTQSSVIPLEALTSVETLPDRMRSLMSILSGVNAAKEAVRKERIKEFLEEIVPGKDDPREIALQSIGRAIRLDLATALRLTLAVLPPNFPLDTNLFGEALRAANRVWNYQEDHSLFVEFLTKLSSELRANT